MPLETEAATYRREVARLLAEGHAGRHALIKGNEVIGDWDTRSDALQAGRDKVGLEDIAVVKIDERDPERFRLMDSRKVSTRAQLSFAIAQDEPIVGVEIGWSNAEMRANR